MKIFLNLLPPERKQLLSRDYFWRFFLGKWFLVFISVFLLGVATALIYFQVYWKYQGALNEKSESDPSGQEQYAEFEKKFEETNVKVRTASNFITLHTSFSALLAEVEKILPEGVKITKFSTKEYQVFLVGTASTRDIFLTLQDNIKGNACFHTLNAPLSNLFSENDVQFQLDFFVKPECIRGTLLSL